MASHPAPRSASGKPNTAFKPPKPVGMSKSQQVTTAIPSSSESEAGSNKDNEDIEMHAAMEEDSAANVPFDKLTSAIPQSLLSRSLHCAFRSPETRITKDAMLLFAQYMDVFIGEAVLRAVEERKKTMEGAQTSGESGEESAVIFLNIDDLEKLAPQLLLDF